MAITLRFTDEQESLLEHLQVALDCPTKSKALLYLLDNHVRLLDADRDLRRIRELSFERDQAEKLIANLTTGF